MNENTDLSNLKSFVLAFCNRSVFKPVIILCYTVLAISLWKYLPVTLHFADDSGHKLLENLNQISFFTFFSGTTKIFGAFVIMGVIPVLIVRYVFKEKLSDYGLGPGNFKRTLRNILIFAPIMIVLGILSGYHTGFYRVYPFNPYAGCSLQYLILHSILYFFFYYSAWEFMFRGFIQKGLESSTGPVVAILIQILASTMLHYGHPLSEVLGCIAGGFLWGFLVYRTRSIISGWVQHALLGVFLDVTLVLLAN